MRRIHEFEALRGFLALWVVVGHVIKHCGYSMDALGPLSLLGDPGLAVDVFIVLSGFVIFSPIDHKHEGYVPFIVRRFFRLYPLCIVVLAVAALLAGTMLDWIRTFPWRTPFIDNLVPIAQASKDALPAQFLVHLTMLHGLVSDSVLRFSQYGLVGQAWSISVEWQFYLLAPLFFLLLRRRPALLALAMIV
jgi:peptidoglycan/LPS O-acetylase OafA/YrhL